MTGRTHTRGVAVGCDVGGTAIKLALVSPHRLVRSLAEPTPRAVAPRELLELLALLVRRVWASETGGGRGLPPVGVALPGYLNERRSGLVHASNLSSLDGARLRGPLSRRLGAPVVLETDSNAGAVGEAVRGAGRAHPRVLYVTLGTGLGAALAAHGEPVRVSHHTVGHVAHLLLDPRGPHCSCGQRGCAEAVLSAGGIARRARRRTTPEGLAAAAKAGDARALAVWKRTGELLGKLLQTLAVLFHPDAIVVGGGISRASNFFLAEARAVLRASLPADFRRPLPVRRAALGELSGAVGAAIRALQGDPPPSAK